MSNCETGQSPSLNKYIFISENLIENANSRTSSKKLGLSEKKIRSKDPYPCPLCNFEATSKIGLRKHKASEHKRILPQCAQCGYSAQNLKELRIHVKNNVACRTNPVNNQKGKKYSIFFQNIFYRFDHIIFKNKLFFCLLVVKKRAKPKEQTEGKSKENLKVLRILSEFLENFRKYLIQRF